jgi:hypothetical protein
MVVGKQQIEKAKKLPVQPVKERELFMTKSRKTKKQKELTPSVSEVKRAKSIDITLACTLYDWSETLTFDEIQDTLFAVDLYVNNEDHSMFTSEGLQEMEAWMKRNDFVKFVNASELGRIAQERYNESLAFAQEISNIPLKIRMEH